MNLPHHVFYVYSEDDAEHHLRCLPRNYDALISISSSSIPLDFYSRFPGQKLRLHMEDVDVPAVRGVTFSAPAPGLGHMENIVDFMLSIETYPTSVLVHCAAGISRSTATAIVAAACHPGWSPSSYMADLVTYRGIHPNPRIIALGDYYLGKNGDLWRAYWNDFGHRYVGDLKRYMETTWLRNLQDEIACH